jgi:hypothetical protein
MRKCSGCQVDVPDASDNCPRCGAIVPRGVLSSLRSLFGGGSRSSAPHSPPAPPEPEAPAGGFRFEVEDVFTITGRGTVVTGRVGSGEVRVGDDVRFETPKGKSTRCRVIGVEAFQKVLQVAKAGETVGLVLSKVGHEDVPPGTVIESA